MSVADRSISVAVVLLVPREQVNFIRLTISNDQNPTAASNGHRSHVRVTVGSEMDSGAHPSNPTDRQLS